MSYVLPSYGPPQGAVDISISRFQATLLGRGCYIENKGVYWMTKEGVRRAKDNDVFIETMLEDRRQHNPALFEMTKGDAIAAMKTMWDIVSNSYP